MSNGNNVYAATNGGFAISTDGGSTFTTKLSGKTTRGLFVSGSNLYAATSANGVYISTDNGSN